MHNKKIMFVSYYYLDAGGVQRVTTTYANYFSKLGAQVVITHMEKSNQSCFYPLDTKIKTISLRSSLQMLVLAKFIITIIKFKPNIIISIDPFANRFVAIAKYIIKNITVIGTEHMYAKNFFTFRYGYGDRFKFIKKYLYHSLDTLVVLTTDSANWLKENNILTNVAIIPNPIVYPLAVSHPIIATNKLIKPKLKTILAVGRLVKIKGFDLLINSFAKIASKYSHWQLVIIGEGPQRLALEQQIFKLSLQQQVKLPGVAGNLHDWYQAVDLFVLSSRNEGLSCVLIEAMAYGLPVVSFNCKSGPSDIIKHEVNGLLVESENTIALSQALIRLIENKSLCHKLSESAIAVRDKYSIENIAQQWLNLFSYLSCKH